MNRSRGRIARRATFRIAASCLLGVATISGTTLASVTSASASCATNHVAVNGYDENNSSAFGNKGYIYVNTSSVIDGLQDAISRSLFLYGPAGYNVEVGWAANENGYRNPTVYAEWEINGTTEPPYYDPNSNGQNLATDSNHRFRVENVGNNGIFRFIFDGDPSPFAYGPTLPFQYGTPHGQSEHYNQCDSLYTHMYDLSYAINETPDWSSSYNDLECYGDTSTTWYFHKNSDSDFDVTQTSSFCTGT